MSTSPSIKSLQILRLIAAVSVAYSHLFAEPHFGTFGVDLFFVLSGFVISLVTSSNQSVVHFAISRFSRIVPIYWLLTSILFVLILLKPHLVAPETLDSASVSNLVKSLLFIPYQGAVGLSPILTQGWTLNYEMLFYLAVGLSLIVTKSRYMYIACASLVLVFVFAFFSQDVVLKGFYGNSIILEFIMGFAGYIAYRERIWIPDSYILNFIVAVGCYAFMTVAECLGLADNRLFWFGIPSFFLLQSALALDRALVVSHPIVRMFTSMGDASYATYLTHWYVIVFVRKILAERLGMIEFYSPLGALVTLSFVLIVGQIIYGVLDRPLNRWVREWLSNIMASNSLKTPKTK